MSIYYTGKDDNNRRLDRVLRKMFPQAGLSQIFHLIRKGSIRINNKKVRPDARICEGDELTIHGLPSPALDRKKSESKNKDKIYEFSRLRKMIIFQNEHLLALNKPGGLLTHGAGSLDELVRDYWSLNSSPSLSFRPGPAHRLDRNTSGLILYSLSLYGARNLSLFFRQGAIDKYYLALMDGKLNKEESWIDRIERNSSDKRSFASDSGKPAATVVRPLLKRKGKTLALCNIATGRTHQIRAQGMLHGHPLSGDIKYQGSYISGGYLLHSICLRLTGNKAGMFFPPLWAPLPVKALRLLTSLFSSPLVMEALKSIHEELLPEKGRL
jgi:23S rRNA pseudouridine955/2504/2580 synthase